MDKNLSVNLRGQTDSHTRTKFKREKTVYICIYVLYICIYIVASIFTNRSAMYIHSLATSLFKLTATAPSTGGRDMLHRMMKLLPGLLLKTKSWRRCGRGFPSLSESSWQSSTSIFFCSQSSGLTQWEIDSVTAFLPMQRSKNTQLLTNVT